MFIILFIFEVINLNASVVSFICELKLEHNCSNWCCHVKQSHKYTKSLKSFGHNYCMS